jgi:hypothetical protein
MRRSISGRGVLQVCLLVCALFCLGSVVFVDKGYLDNAVVGTIIFSIALWANHERQDVRDELENDQARDECE